MWEVMCGELQRLVCFILEIDGKEDLQKREEKYFKNLKDYMFSINKFFI